MTTRADDVERADAIAGARETAPLLDVIAHDAHDGDDVNAPSSSSKVLRAKIGVVSALALVGAGALCATAFGTVSSLGGASTGATSSIDGDALDAGNRWDRRAARGVVGDRAGLGDAWVDRFETERRGDQRARAERLAGKRRGFGLPVFLHLPKNGARRSRKRRWVTWASPRGSVICLNTDRRDRTGCADARWDSRSGTRLPRSTSRTRGPSLGIRTSGGGPFIWSIRLTPGGIFDALNPGYSNFNCERFQDFVKDSIKGLVASDLRKCYQEKRYTMQGMGESRRQPVPS